MNFGFEIEFFAADKKNRKIFNATKLIQDFLRLDLVFEGYDLTRNPTLLNSTSFDIISDGTPFEIVGKRNACENSMLGNQGQSAAKEINKYLNKIRGYTEKLFKVDTILTPFVESKDWEFIEPGHAYSSGKQKFNAYSGRDYYEDKKDEFNKLVSFRSTGFHIHIKFDDEVAKKMFEGMYAPAKCNELIQNLDKVYKEYFPKFLDSKKISEQEESRTEKYAILGDYRIKYHDNKTNGNGFSTLEYRQFSSAFFLLDESLQQKILHDFANTVRKFTNKLKNNK